MQIQTLEGLLRSLLCLSIFGVLVVIGEILKRKNYISGELARKFVHTTTGTWAALWPLFLDLDSIAFMAIILTIGALAVRFFAPLKSIYSIGRLSLGEIFIGLGIAVSAWLAESGSVYSASVLIISWSDSVAAIIGTTYGAKNSFKVFKSKKSIFGSAAFLFTTMAIILGYYLYEYGLLGSSSEVGLATALMYSLGISFILTFTEMVGVFGLDNFSVPILAMLLLNLA